MVLDASCVMSGILLARRPPLQRIPGWAVYHDTAPWEDLYVRAGGGVIIGLMHAGAA